MRLNKILAFVWGWLLIIVFVVGSIHTIALDKDFYIARYEKMDLADSLSVSNEDLNESITLLLDYIQDKTDSLDATITIHGHKQETFNEREKAHMVDVKALYQGAIRVGVISFVGLLVILFYFLWRQRQGALAYLSRGFLETCLCVLILAIVFGIWIATDFTSFWNWFHTLFFSNDLWLLDPATDFMINMLPETIFYQLVLGCVSMLGILILPCLAFSIYYVRKKVPIGFYG